MNTKSESGESGEPGESGAVAAKNAEVPQMKRLVAACELTLLFYTVGPWTAEKRTQWSEKMASILGPVDKRDPRTVGDNGDGTWDGARPSNEATTKNLCNAVRAALTP
jgi:hypothetical protein